ncbi:MAG: response regulator [Arcobacter sp.]|nr:response regulator [Arcobacter sp.]
MANILVVDDAKIMRFHISKLLKELGHTVMAEAQNGSEAISEYKKNKPDFVTMDITMPESDDIKSGIDAVGKIMEFDPTATVIMVSAQGDKEKVLQAIENGAAHFVQKPVTLDKLKEAIDQFS